MLSQDPDNEEDALWKKKLPIINTDNRAKTRSRVDSTDTIKGTTISSGILSVPPVNPKIDIRKWNWQGVLTFGLSSNSQGKEKKPYTPVTAIIQPMSKSGNIDSLPHGIDKSDENNRDKDVDPLEGKAPERSCESAEWNDGDIKVELNECVRDNRPSVEVSVDESALEEALASQDILVEVGNEQSPERNVVVNANDLKRGITSKAPDSIATSTLIYSESSESQSVTTVPSNDFLLRVQDAESNIPSNTANVEQDGQVPPTPPPVEHPPTFSRMTVHIGQSEDNVETRKEEVLYMKV